MVVHSQKPAARVKKVHHERRRYEKGSKARVGAAGDVTMSREPQEITFADPVINSCVLASAKKDFSNESPLSVEELFPQFEQPYNVKGRLILRKFIHRDIFTWYSSQNRKVPRDLVLAEQYLLHRDSTPATIPPRSSSIFAREHRGAIYPDKQAAKRDFSFGPEKFNPRPITPPPDMSESEESSSPGLTSAGSPPSSISSVSSPEMEHCAKPLRVVKKRKSAADIQRSLGVENKKRVNHRKSISDLALDDDESKKVNRKLKESFKVAYVPLNDIATTSESTGSEDEEFWGSTATLTNNNNNKLVSRNSVRSVSSGEGTASSCGSSSSSVRRTRSKSLGANETKKLLPRISSLFANSTLKPSDEDENELDTFDFTDSPTAKSQPYRQYATGGGGRCDAPRPMSHPRRTVQPHHNSVDAGIPPRVPPHRTLSSSSIARQGAAAMQGAPQNYARLAEMNLQSKGGAIGLGVSAAAPAAPHYQSYTRKCSFKNKAKGHGHSRSQPAVSTATQEQATVADEDPTPRFMLPGYSEEKPLAVVNGSPKPKPRKKDFKFEEPVIPIPRETGGRGRLGRKIWSCYDKMNHTKSEEHYYYAGGKRSTSGYTPPGTQSSQSSSPRAVSDVPMRAPDLTLCLLGRGDSLWNDRGKGFLARHS